MNHRSIKNNRTKQSVILNLLTAISKFIDHEIIKLIFIQFLFNDKQNAYFNTQKCSNVGEIKNDNKKPELCSLYRYLLLLSLFRFEEQNVLWMVACGYITSNRKKQAPLTAQMVSKTQSKRKRLRIIYFVSLLNGK